jgi:autotransporter-associated beta strand protein
MRCWTVVVFVLVVVEIACGWSIAVHAQHRTDWQGGSGDWFNQNNWTFGVPDANAISSITGGTVNIAAGNAMVNVLGLDNATLNQTGGTLNVGYAFSIYSGGTYILGGDGTLVGSATLQGTVIQNGGVANASFESDGGALYQLHGGEMAGALDLTSTAFTPMSRAQQDGGLFSGNLYLSGAESLFHPAVYEFHDGQFTGNISIGTNGEFHVFGGQINPSSITLGIGNYPGLAKLTIDAGSITTDLIQLGGPAFVGQFGGTVQSKVLTLDPLGIGCRYVLFEGAILNTTDVSIGGEGLFSGSAAVFEQVGGTHTIANSLTVDGTDTPDHDVHQYELYDGTLTAPTEMIGTFGTGNFIHSGGTNTVTDLTVGGVAFGVGSYTQSGGTLNATHLDLGVFGTGTFEQSGGVANFSTVTIGSSGGSIGNYAQTGGNTRITTRLVLGADTGGGSYVFSGGTLTTADTVIGTGGIGTFTNTNAVSPHIVTGNLSIADTFVRVPIVGVSTYELGAGARLQIAGNVDVSHTEPGVVVGDYGIFRNNGGTITGTGPASTLFAHGPLAAIVGRGTYDIPVVYESAPVYGALANQSVNIGFARSHVLESTQFTVRPGLMPGNSGDIDLVNGVTLPGSRFTLSWGAGDDSVPRNIDYVPGAFNTAGGDDRATIQVPYAPEDVRGIPGISFNHVFGRIGLLQFGQNIGAVDPRTYSDGIAYTSAGPKNGLVRNITESSDEINRVVIGRAENVGGAMFDPANPKVHGFDVAVQGIAVAPVHQDPSISLLRSAAYNLTGKGVVIGQLEPGRPYFDHGCFDDWSNPSPGAMRAATVFPPPAYNGSSAHATRVASIMVGYDPFGLQVDGQSVLATPDQRYNGGTGFTGVAPQALLRSLGTSETLDGVQTLAATNVAGNPVKIINMSFGGALPGGFADDRLALSIDQYTESHGLIVTKSAGNFGPAPASISDPGGNYNGIVVGNAQFDVLPGGVNNPHPIHFDIAHATVEPSSSRGPTSDPLPRAKPDLVAQGTGNLAAFTMEYTDSTGKTSIDPAYPEQGNRGLYSTMSRNAETAANGRNADDPNVGTSFAAPTVAGVAALMVQDARTHLHSASAESPLVIKSVLQTSADKKPGDWAKGDGSAANQVSTIPLSYKWGAGLMNPVAAVNLLDKGTPADFGNVRGNGWVLGDLTPVALSPYEGPGGVLSGDGYLLRDVRAHQPFTLTLNWYSHVSGLPAGPAVRAPLSKLDVQLYSFDSTQHDWEPIANGLSDSAVDNLQHIYFSDLPRGGDVLARVYTPGLGFPDARADEPYALSWSLATRDIIWTGGVDGTTWDIATTKNWKNLANSQPDTFFNDDSVTFDDTAGHYLVSLNVPVTVSSMLVNNSAGDYLFFGDGSIGGSGALTKSGTGALTLAMSNSYTGGTVLNAGTLNLNHASAIGSGTLTINGGAIDNTSGAPVALSTDNAQAWNADINFTGSNSLDLGIGPVTLSGNRTVSVGANTLSVGGAIGDGGNGFGLTKAGAGTLVLGGASTYGGPVAVNQGTLVVAADSPNGGPGPLGGDTGAVVLGMAAAGVAARLLIRGPYTVGRNINVQGGASTIGTAIDSPGAFTGSILLNNSVTIQTGLSPAGSVTFTTGNIAGPGGVNVAGPGITTFAGNNSYTGGTIVNGGTLSVSADSNLGAATSGVSINQATLLSTASFSTARPISLGHLSSTIDVTGATNTLNLMSSIGGTGSLTKGPLGGTLLLSHGGTVPLPNLTVLGGSVNASGTTTLSIAGMATITNGARLIFLPGGAGASGRLTHQITTLAINNGGTLDLGNHELLTQTSPGTIKSYLAHAYDAAGNQDWSQSGLTSSLARDNPAKYSVGYAYGGDASAQDAGVTTHGGAALAANQTIARVTLAGDANLDGRVDFFDISQLLGYKYNTGQAASYTDGDLNYDGKVDFFDLSLLLSANYNTGEQLVALAQPAAAPPTLTGGGAVAPLAIDLSAQPTAASMPSIVAGIDGVLAPADTRLGSGGDDMLLRYQAQNNWTLQPTGLPAASVPEPSIALLGLAVIGLLPRRRGYKRQRMAGGSPRAGAGSGPGLAAAAGAAPERWIGSGRVRRALG